MDPMLYACAAVFVAILLYFVNKGKQNNEERKPRARPVRVENDGPGGRRQAARRRGIGARIQEQEARREELNAERDSDELDEDGEPKEKTKEKIGAKKLRKLQDKEQKKVQREAELREREEQKKRREEKDKDIREKEEQELFEQKREEEEEEKIRLEKERLEMEEYLKLKEEFSIEEEGEQEGEVDESEMENLLQQFIDYVKETKVIFLEDLASHFGLRVQDAIDRVQSLLEEGTLTGVIDDRGKFIYISMEELRGVADFINNQGRISITELAKASNSLINLKQDEEVLVLGEAA